VLIGWSQDRVSAVPPPVNLADAPVQGMPEELLIARGDYRMSLGDPTGARHFYEPAAARGSSRGATSLGKMLDPLYRQRAGLRGSGDPAEAAEWYRKAAAGGSVEAEIRLKDLEAWLSNQGRK